MKILVSRIPKEGIKQDLTEKEGWVRELVLQATHNRYPSESPIQGSLSILETVKNVSVKGEIRFSMRAACDRCLKEYPYPVHVFFDRILSPLFKSERERSTEKSLNTELTEEDLGFSYYKGEEIDVGNIIQEQIVLAQPIVTLCQENCKGLCPHCGVNRNEKTCSCRTFTFEESPFAVLKKKKFEG